MPEIKGQRPVGTVLVVDDVEASTAALELACSAIPGITVSTASSALEAVRYLQSHGELIRAVLTDIRMPVMDGFDLIRVIRADPRFSALPIIVLTADTDPDTPARIAQSGANAYFAKPFSPRAVRETLERLLNANPSAE